MAGFNYNTNLTAVLNALRDYNTTTSTPDLSDGLGEGRRVKDENIRIGDPDVEMIRANRLPAIFVRIDSANEDFSGIGETGSTKNSKFKDVTYSIFAVFGRAGGSERHADAMEGVSKMVQNIEAVFQTEFDLSSTAMWCQPKRTVISNVPLDPQGATWIKVAAIDLEARYFFR